MSDIKIDLHDTQQRIEWLSDSIYLDTRAYKAAKRSVLRGQVYKCKLGIGIGSEERKDRPCLIIQNNGSNRHSPNVIVAPITHTSYSSKTVIPVITQHTPDGNVLLDGYILLGNIACVSKARLGDYITKLTAEEMKKVDEAISISLGIDHRYTALKNMYDDKLVYIEKLKAQIEELKKVIDKAE